MNNEENQSLFAVTQERLYNGIIKENPTFVLLLGMCPTLAVTTSAINGLGMGVTTMLVLAMSNMFISLLRKVIPSKVRIPAYIVIIASFVTILELLLKGYIPTLYEALGLYIPLIVVNCIILGRAEAYASSHGVIPSLFDGIGMGLGFTFALTIIGSVREILGTGAVFNYHFMPQGYVPVNIFVMAPGAFFVLALLTAIQNKAKEIGIRHGKDMSKIQSGCDGNCSACPSKCEEENKTLADVEDKLKAKDKAKIKEKDNEKPEEEADPSDNSEAETDEAIEKESINPSDNALSDHESGSSMKETVEEPSVTADLKTDTEADSEVLNEDLDHKDDVNSEGSTDEDDDVIEFLNLDDYKKVINKSKISGRKPSRKKTSEKAAKLLSKAEEKIKEAEEDND